MEMREMIEHLRDEEIERLSKLILQDIRGHLFLYQGENPPDCLFLDTTAEIYLSRILIAFRNDNTAIKNLTRLTYQVLEPNDSSRQIEISTLRYFDKCLETFIKYNLFDMDQVSLELGVSLHQWLRYKDWKNMPCFRM